MQDNNNRELEVHESIIKELLALNEKVTKTRLDETEAIENIVSNIFVRIAYYLKAKGAEAKQTGTEELAAYESVMQKLLTLREKVIDARLNEAKEIRTILYTLSALQESEREPSMLSSSEIPPTEDTESILSIGRENIVIYAN